MLNLCAVIPGLELKLGLTALPPGALATLAEVARFVAEVANLPADEHMAYVGRSAFAHKGGVHVAAMRRSADSYQHIDPALVGNESRVVVSELAGRANLMSKAEEHGLETASAAHVLGEVKRAEARGFSYEAAEASVALLLRRREPGYRAPFTLLSYKVIATEAALTEATIKIAVDGRASMHTAAEGNGPVPGARPSVAQGPRCRAARRSRASSLHDYKVPDSRRAAGHRSGDPGARLRGGRAALVDHGGRVGQYPRSVVDRARRRDRVRPVDRSGRRDRRPNHPIRKGHRRGSTRMKANIILLPGDGIGGEVVAEGRAVLETVADRFDHQFHFAEHLIGGCGVDAQNSALSDETIAACRASHAILLGAVGGPKWDNPDAKVRPEQGLLRLRRDLKLYANLRPVKVFPELAEASPLKADRLAGVDMLFVRELTGGLYFGPKERTKTHAFDTMVYNDVEIRRVVELAFKLAAGRRGKVTSLDKQNVLATSVLWRQIANEVGAQHPSIKLDHQLVDSAAMRIITHAAAFDVLVTENMFGDILTDEAAVLAGSLGMLPSASLGDGTLGVYEPIHGSAPDIAGRGNANPIGTILSAAMLLRHSLGLEAEAAAVEAAVAHAITAGCRTRDIGGQLSTRQMGEAIRAAIGR